MNQKQPSEVPQEPSRRELEESVPKELLDAERCGIEENVTFKPRSGAAPLAVRFDASASTAPCGTIVKWQWDFGDGTTGAGRRVTHTYSTPGTYQVSVKMADKAGHINLAVLTYQVEVKARTPARPAGRRVRREPLRKASN